MAYKFQLGNSRLSGSIYLSDTISGSLVQATDVQTSPNSLIVGAVTVSETDVGAVAGVTPGTAAANKNLVVDSNIDIENINTGSFNHIIVNSLEVSSIDITSVISETVQTISSTSTLNIDNGTIILANASSGNITITLPAASANSGKILKFKKSEGTSNVANIQPASGESIDGQSNQIVSLESPFAALSLICDGTGYYII